MSTISSDAMTYLPRDGDPLTLLEPDRTLTLVLIVEDNGHGGLGDTSLTTFVDQVLEILRTDLQEIVAKRSIARRQCMSLKPCVIDYSQYTSLHSA